MLDCKLYNNGYALHDEIIGATLAIEINFDKYWKFLTLECELAVSASNYCKLVSFGAYK